MGYNRNYFNTYGPTQNIFYRQGSLDATVLTARVEHNWQVSPTYNLRYGIDIKGDLFTGETLSNVPRLIRLNEVEERDRTDVFSTLFNLNWDCGKPSTLSMAVLPIPAWVYGGISHQIWLCAEVGLRCVEFPDSINSPV